MVKNPAFPFLYGDSLCILYFFCLPLVFKQLQVIPSTLLYFTSSLPCLCTFFLVLFCGWVFFENKNIIILFSHLMHTQVLTSWYS